MAANEMRQDVACGGDEDDEEDGNRDVPLEVVAIEDRDAISFSGMQYITVIAAKTVSLVAV